jgi:16S rRNA (cytidine1402-2'-O)-methyltransferase
MNKISLDCISSNGKLWIVGIPIGNLGDITFRAVEVLRFVDIVAAEDTRRATWLLNHFNIQQKSVSCHQHNVSKRVGRFVTALAQGKNIAYITDAGTPGISDPGPCLVKEIVAAGFQVIPVPGPSVTLHK